jgi:hypothetical protein
MQTNVAALLITFLCCNCAGGRIAHHRSAWRTGPAACSVHKPMAALLTIYLCCNCVEGQLSHHRTAWRIGPAACSICNTDDMPLLRMCRRPSRAPRHCVAHWASCMLNAQTVTDRISLLRMCRRPYRAPLHCVAQWASCMASWRSCGRTMQHCRTHTGPWWLRTS